MLFIPHLGTASFYFRAFLNWGDLSFSSAFAEAELFEEKVPAALSVFFISDSDKSTCFHSNGERQTVVCVCAWFFVVP